MIPMLDLKQQYQELKPEIELRIRAVLESGQFILGPNVMAFEQEVADYLGVDQVVSCASGTDALHLALKVAGIGPGDEVITTAFSFIATAEAIRYVGAIPVFVDIDPHTFNIDPDQIQQAITKKTKAVLPVHLFGQPADMSAIVSICHEEGLELIEDCAQSFGAHVNNRQTGSFGILGCFSFFPSKNLGCYGDGGMVSTASGELAKRLRMLRNHGCNKLYHHELIGLNSRLDEIQAVVLRTKLKQVDAYNKDRRRVAKTYNRLLSGVKLTTPYEDNRGYHVYHQYTILTPERDKVMNHLKDAGIASAIYYPVSLHKQNAFKGACKALTLSRTEQVVQQCLSLPMYPELKDEVIEEIVAVIKDALAN
ncbi:MAG: DegT/DnrJ/EryC1/StrS family aminotransferase [Gammaproteobacteria bacterium]|nr:DegT/DnrJ/EryC1/StrS family aminotransferase [Gammaproteobacteria bacterium]MCI0591689.1 DegT/DnrJ/EryC1/StrS family aminotransferase [Gammaproteobacteria bacterium]